MAETRAYGEWASPIGSADLVRGALRLSAPRIDAGRIYWLEGRPDEGGRQVVVSARLPANEAALAAGQSDPRECSPPKVNVRTRVHEYGGGEYAVHRGRIYFVDDADGLIYVGEGEGAARPLVQSSDAGDPHGAYYADLVVSPDGTWLFAIEERPRAGSEPENRVVAFDLRRSDPAPPTLVTAGHDFYASIAVAPGGDRLAFLAWDHPNMPWNGTWLELIEWGADGPRGEARSVAGGVRESLFQPRFRADGALFVATDRSGFWNLARLGGDGLQPIHGDAFDVGRAQWVFGQSSYAFTEIGASRGMIAVATRDGIDELVSIDEEKGSSRTRSTDLCSIAGLESGEGWVACVAGTPSRASGLYLFRADGGAPVCVRESSPFSLPEAVVSRVEPLCIPSVDGRETHAFVYLPRSESQQGPPGERPPLLVKSHGGPTSMTSPALDPRIQFWTSRGFAVADVNYGGSTGYGRRYRDLLERQWGVVDVEDCVAVAESLAKDGLVDGQRRAISGGSAGGFTTLCALTFQNTFAAGASHYGIGDLEALARDTHKFESRYTDWLVGPLPEDRARYIERSPIHHSDRLACPIIFFQGLEDRVVPPNQAEAMVEILARRGLAHAYVPFEGEQHGFRRAENIRTALDGELYFYSRVFGFEAERPAPVRVIEPSG